MKNLKIFFLFTLVMILFTGNDLSAQLFNQDGVEILIYDKYHDVLVDIPETPVKFRFISLASTTDEIKTSAIYNSDGKLVATIYGDVLTPVNNRNGVSESIEKPMTLIQQVWYWLWRVALAIVILSFVTSMFVITKQKKATIIERFGKFVGIRKPGLGLKIPWIDVAVDTVNLRIYELNVPVTTITKDKVTVDITASIHIFVENTLEAIEQSYYAFSDDNEQIKSYVFDEVRSQVPLLILDDVFEKKDQIADAVKSALVESISKFGFSISKVLVTKIDPEESVANAMNKINEEKRLRIAAEEKGEGIKILAIKKAEAESESKELQGRGIANQRKAIAKGMKESLETLKDTGISGSEASALMVVTQHYDTMESMGKNANSNLVILPSSPGAAGDIMTQMLSALKASEMSKEKK